MGFSEFTLSDATMQKITTDGAGDETVSLSFSVEIDPVLGFRRIFTRDNEEVNGAETIIAPHPSIDPSHRKWKLVYSGNTYDVERLEPFYHIGTEVVEHYEVTLR